ncbi:MAG TPA: phytanoyl-CoA dioxygenase, partial [Halieaceae bacterium]|nr:phytanoyl-CoA dioxygenase [Halieaceae bacterium]
LGYAIAARKERFPEETAYEYKPFTEQSLSFVWDDAARADIHDYNRDDLSI